MIREVPPFNGRNLDDLSWLKKLPWIQFKPEWEVKVIPPHTLATLRFLVKKAGSSDDNLVSVYFDGYSMLGSFNWPSIPHWEIYPDEEGTNSRFEMSDTKGLLEAIEKALK